MKGKQLWESDDDLPGWQNCIYLFIFIFFFGILWLVAAAVLPIGLKIRGSEFYILGNIRDTYMSGSDW